MRHLVEEDEVRLPVVREVRVRGCDGGGRDEVGHGQDFFVQRQQGLLEVAIGTWLVRPVWVGVELFEFVHFLPEL